MRTGQVALAAVGACMVAAGGLTIGAGRDASPGRTVSFARQVQPIFDRSCTSCHPVSYPYLDLRRGNSHAQLVRVPAATNPAFDCVLPGRPEFSYLLIHPPDPSNAALVGEKERRLLQAWILAGAPDK